MAADAPTVLPVGQLRVGDLAVDHADDTLSLSVRLDWDDPVGAATLLHGRRLRVEIGNLDRLGGDRRHLLAANTPANATAFVPVLAVLAAASGADLTIDAPVCPQALANARRAVAVGQVDHGWPAITLGASAGATTTVARGGAGFVFSLGFEGLAALVEQRQSAHPTTHLLAFDPLTPPEGDANAAVCGWGEGTSRWERRRDEVMAANAARLPLIRVATNAAEFTDVLVDAVTANAAMAATCSLVLAGVVSSVTLPQTPHDGATARADLQASWSSGAVVLDPLRSSASLPERAALVATDPWACHWLRVCGERRNGHNCGLCSSCQLALTALWLAAGSPAGDLAFGHTPDPAVVRSLAWLPDDISTQCPEVIWGLRAVADGSAPRRHPDATDRLLAAELADAWQAQLHTGRVHQPRIALSA